MERLKVGQAVEKGKEKAIYWVIFLGAVIEVAIANMGREQVWEVKNETDGKGKKHPVVRLKN